MAQGMQLIEAAGVEATPRPSMPRHQLPRQDNAPQSLSVTSPPPCPKAPPQTYRDIATMWACGSPGVCPHAPCQATPQKHGREYPLLAPRSNGTASLERYAVTVPPRWNATQ